MSQTSQERTEQPTSRRLQDARRKGKVARTKEAGQAASLIAATVALGWIGDDVLSRLGHALAAGIGRMGALARALYAEAEVGDVIPGALFEAVAEVLAYLIRLKQLVL